MRTEGKEYFKYMTERSSISLLLRRLFYRSIIKELNGKLLDIGSGVGEFLTWHPNSVGIDTNPYLVDYCKKRGLKCFLGSAYKIPFKNGQFDSVLCSHLLEHLNRPEAAFREIKRVLRKGGKLIIILPTEKGFKRDKTHVKFWDENSLRQLLKKFGFRVKKLAYYPTKSLRNCTYLGELRVVAVKT
jgi:ubiquinone/menaquinone biosynthesis C-methylase UbiE